MYKIVATGKLFPEVAARLRQHCEIKMWEESGPIPRAVLYDWLSDAEGLFSTGVPIDPELLAHAPRLRVIAQSSVGYDNIDIPACTARNIPVGNTPGVLVDATADLAFGLLLCSARRIHEGWNFVKDNQWTTSRHLPLGIDLARKTLGIVGMGSIGAAVARRALAFGMKVIYHNRRRRVDDVTLGAEYSSFNHLLEQSDFVLILSPLTEETRGMFGLNEFKRMKNTAYLINAARGGIVNTDALVTALTDGLIAYAALDVTDPEPLPQNHPLAKLPNVLITPHIGSATIETRLAMAMLTADNLLAGLQGKPLPACVNSEVNYK